MAKTFKERLAEEKEKRIHPTRIFREESEMQNAWDGFKADLKEQAKEWLKVQYVGKEGERVADAQKVPLTLEGFKRYCRTHHGEVEQYFSNKDKLYNDFVGICSRIREEIRENQIIGGMLGFFNPSITQRLNGLNETINNNITSVSILNVDPLDDGNDKQMD